MSPWVFSVPMSLWKRGSLAASVSSGSQRTAALTEPARSSLRAAVEPLASLRQGPADLRGGEVEVGGDGAEEEVAGAVGGEGDGGAGGGEVGDGLDVLHGDDAVAALGFVDDEDDDAGVFGGAGVEYIRVEGWWR
jgi:hypothetical protein